MQNTQIDYLYRDGSNYKRFNSVIIRGLLTEEMRKRIKKCLDSGEYFVPRQVGLPEIRVSDTRNEDDGAFFEWMYMDNDGNPDVTYTEAEPTIDLSAEELVSNFEAVEEWDTESWLADYPEYEASEED